MFSGGVTSERVQPATNGAILANCPKVYYSLQPSSFAMLSFLGLTERQNISLPASGGKWWCCGQLVIFRVFETDGIVGIGTVHRVSRGGFVCISDCCWFGGGVDETNAVFSYILQDLRPGQRIPTNHFEFFHPEEDGRFFQEMLECLKSERDCLDPCCFY